MDVSGSGNAQDSGLYSDFKELTDADLCKGCQDFKKIWFEAALESSRIQETVIHESFAELSRCADTCCDLCKFIRREFHYLTDEAEYDEEEYAGPYRFSNEDFTDAHRRVRVQVYSHGKNHTLRWQLFLGHEYGFSSETNFQSGMPALQPREESPSINTLLELTQSWLLTCRAEHKRCADHAKTKPIYLPTRLLDVGLPGQQNIQLFHSKDLPNTGILDYVTLSYCWGKANDAACTTQENLDERLHTITVSLLPRTIQDAITITRGVGVRYLWVDALCIIQDKGGKNEDWVREFPSVGKVYRHALFSIAASGAQSSSDGCFYRREAALWPMQNYQLIDKNRAPGPRNPLPFKATPPGWRESVEHSALEKRGWALQERMLSSRTLYCTDNGFFWCCKELAASEFKVELGLWECNLTTLDDVVRSMIEHGDGETWMKTVQWFSGKALTVSTDRLPAIEGVGSEVARLTGKKYEMGMFKHNAVKELAWQTNYMSRMGHEQPLMDPQPNRLPGPPSWSWASTSQKLVFRPDTGFSSKEVEGLAAILSISGCRLRVLGWLGRLHVQKMDFASEYGYRSYSTSPRTFRATRVRGTLVFDTLADTLPEEGGYIKCLRWLRFHHPAGHRATGAMVISPVDEAKNVYRRTGWIELQDDFSFEEEYRDIVIV